MSLITKTQQNSLSPVTFVMDKDILKLIPKVSNNSLFSNDTIWQRVAFVFKHTNSSKRFTPSFRNLTSSKTASLKTGMNPGDSFKLRKIIIKSGQSYLVIKENEIPNVISFDFTLLNTQSPQTVRLGYPNSFNNWVHSIVQQADGKLLVGGDFTNYNGTNINRIIRLNINGSIDSSFNVGTGFSGENSASGRVNKIFLQPDGKIIVIGYFRIYNGVIVNGIVKLNPDGSIDNSFNTGTGFDYSPEDIIRKSDGSFIIVGKFLTYNGTETKYIVKLNSDGNKDETFNAGGVGANNWIYSIKEDSGGRLIVGGIFNSYNNNNQTIGQPSLTNTVARINSDGSVDTQFNLPSSWNHNGSTFKICLQPDGKIILGGIWTVFNGNPSGSIIRLNSDGSVDSGFNTGTGFNDKVNSIFLQPDGKIIVGGQFSHFNGASANKIVRLNTDGTRDNSFNVGTGFSSTSFTTFIISILQQTNNKIVMGGSFENYKGTSFGNIIRLESDGSLEIV